MLQNVLNLTGQEGWAVWACLGHGQLLYARHPGKSLAGDHQSGQNIDDARHTFSFIFHQLSGTIKIYLVIICPLATLPYPHH